MSGTERQAVVAEARTWLKTPYHHKAAIKGAGVDCAYLLIEVYHDALGFERPDVGDYPMDWMFHRDDERYLGWLRKYGTEIDAPSGPGDVAIWKFGRCFSHAAIIADYPTIIHAWRKAGMVLLDDADKGELVGREVKYFTFWGN